MIQQESNKKISKKIKHCMCKQLFMIIDSFKEKDKEIINTKINSIKQVLNDKDILINFHIIKIKNYTIPFYVCKPNINKFIKNPKQEETFIDLFEKLENYNKISNKVLLEKILDNKINYNHLQKNK